MSAIGGPATVTSGLVLELDAGNIKSYPTTGTTWFDKSGLGNNGTLTNGPTFNTGSLGSIVFDGVDDYVSVADASSLNFNTAISVDFWVYVNSYGSGGTMFIHQQNGGNVGGFEIWVSTNGIIRFNKNQSIIIITTSASFSLNGWQNIVCTTDGTNANVFMNNSIIGSAAGLLPDNVDGILRIGNWSAGGYQLNGRMSSIKLYNRALSVSEVQQNFNATRARFGI